MRIRVNQSQGGVKGVKRQFNAAVKTGVMAAVEYWHARYLPDHFTVQGGKKYGYKPRRGDDEPPRMPSTRRVGNQGFYGTKSNNAYSWRKRREKGHNRPLVWSGDSEQQARAGIRLSARRSAAEEVIRGVGVMDVPKYFYQYRKDHDAPDKADELTRVTADEQADLARVFEQSMGAAMAAPGGAAAVSTLIAA